MSGWFDKSSIQLELLNSIYNSPVTIAVLDHHGLIRDLNRDPYDIFGYHGEEMLGGRFADWLDEDSYDDAVQTYRRTIAGEKCTQSIRVVGKSGQTVNLNVFTAPLVKDEETIGVVIFMNDVSDHKRSLDRIHYMAYYDDMTGLPNRRHFTQCLEDRLDRIGGDDCRLAVCYLDVDRFKLVNASFGRDAGDILLLQIAERLTRFFHEPDSLARMEGDEFAGMLAVRDIQDAGDRLEELIRLFDNPFELGGVPLHVSVSIGVMIGGGTDEDASALLKKADTALYRAKENGRNDYSFYTDDVEHDALHKLTLQHEMMNALQNHEFLLHYQPQYDLESGRIVGLEALVRWNHPVRGLVPPGEFIPAAEESGIIVPLGDWVLQEACRQNKEWQEAGMAPIPVSVNLSFRQFTQRNLIGKIASVLKQTSLDPQYLELEITESITMDLDRASLFLKEVRELGVGISIDDFGTGYSSFHYLRHFPIGCLKIDRSFVQDIVGNSNNAAIVSAIIDMAHNLQMDVIAEGVETIEQVSFLRNRGCDEMQGYYGSPPVPGHRIAELMAEPGEASAF
ncbi:putative bifunctional diguanylate cyclase/phosphodiesterase [Cohnella zeiphila]|uniref:putative bifunctional diguanylate cyclase/phosphodiesterase n=1 Tax=Cohnella zeiphila TaxID=2761120 RepID=UPI0030809795